MALGGAGEIDRSTRKCLCVSEPIEKGEVYYEARSR